MLTLSETQLKELSAWLAASSADEKSPMGYRIVYGPYGQLVAVALDDLPPDLSSGVAAGCLPLLVPANVPAAPFVAPQAQAKLDERAAHIVWLSGAAISDSLRGFPACRVVRVAQGQTLRQAAVAAGIDPDADRLTVGIPEICF